MHFVFELNIVPTQKNRASITTLKEKRYSLSDVFGTSDTWNERRFPCVYSPDVSFWSRTQRASHNPACTDDLWPLYTSILSQQVRL